MNVVKEHFETEAKAFDEIIMKLIPFYDQMVEALVSAIPYDRKAFIDVIDLGCGTGTIARKVVERFPNATITCIDLAENMIEMAKDKLSFHMNSRFMIKDFNYYQFDQKYQVVVSSLALHHLLTDDDKKIFYQKIYNSLEKGGAFYNADVILASNEKLQKAYIDKWVAFMGQTVSMNEIENNWLEKYRAEDHPARMMDQLYWLSKIGFRDVDVIWKYYNFAVYGGIK